MLAAATLMVMIVGQGVLGIIPIMVVGALIFFLGIDLMREAIKEPLGKLTILEYLTVSQTSRSNISRRVHKLIVCRSSSL